jgi:hypothetical protein
MKNKKVGLFSVVVGTVFIYSPVLYLWLDDISGVEVPNSN